MPYKLAIMLSAMVVSGVSILVFAVGSSDMRVTDLASKVIHIEMPVSSAQGTCSNDAEMLAIEHSFDANRLAKLNVALQNLHNTTEDPLWQLVTDWFKPKAIRLNPTDFSTSDAETSVEISRQVKRITVNYPNGSSTTEQGAYLTYDVRADHTGKVSVVENELYGNTNLPNAIYTIKDKAFNHIDKPQAGGQLSDCAAKAMPRLLPELNWRIAAITDKPYCQLQGLHNTKPVINFYINCPASLS